MTDREKIIKGLECCASVVTMCKECPYEIGQCTKVKEDALDYIAELEERIAIMTEGKPEVVCCKDCKHYYKGNCLSDDTIYWCREPEWFCADGERK